MASESLISHSSPSRLLGLIGFVETKCDNPQALYYRSEDLDWPHFVFVAVVVTLYWFLATEIRYDNNDQVWNSSLYQAPITRYPVSIEATSNFTVSREFSTQNYDNITDRISQKLQIWNVLRGRKASLVDVARLAPMRSRYRVTGVFDIRQSSLQNKLWGSLLISSAILILLPELAVQGCKFRRCFTNYQLVPDTLTSKTWTFLP